MAWALLHGASLFDLASCVSFHITPHCLKKQEHGFGLWLSDVQVWHSLAFVLDEDVSLVCVLYKLSIVKSGVVGDKPDLLEDLKRHNCRNPSFVEPHLLDGPHVSGGVYPTQPCVAVSHKAAFLHFHIPQVIMVWGACVAGTHVDVQVAL